MELVTVPLADLTPHPRNVREGDVGAIVESIRANGIYRPLVVQSSTGHILAGNHTFYALAELGYAEAPVTYVDVDDATALRILLVDNRTSDLATYDEAALAELLADLAVTPSALSGTGYDLADLDLLLGDLSRDVERAGAPEAFGDLRQVILLLGTDDFARLVATFAEMQRRDVTLDSNSACALRLLSRWAADEGLAA